MKVLWPCGLMGVVALACTADQAPQTSTQRDTVSACVHSVVVNPGYATLHVGDTLRLRADACSVTTWQWASSRDTIAAVDSAGLVRALRSGTVTIIASAVVDPNVKGAAAITVAP